MSVLIAYASAHSSTSEIAQQIADRLLKAGVAAIVRPVSQVTSIEPHQAIVLGSALHDRQWLPEAAEFLAKFSSSMSGLPVWLFSTGDGDEHDECAPRVADSIPQVAREGHAVESARAALLLRGHRHFEGPFGRGGWGQLRDLFWRICGGPPDPREFHDVNEWAAVIAREVHATDHIRERRRLHLSVRGRP